jgi:hypothetical protein
VTGGTIFGQLIKILGEQPATMSNVIAVLNEERTRVARRLAALDAALKALGHEGEVKVKRTWKSSVAARAKISKAAKARWAKIRK